ncbi:MAG: efflux RND transporter permease subunit [Gemmatimonadetes bacterium]|nr:efflux RND transporter permease subunit [Gemmatimonadota bacterium]NNF38358.1 efflux RND transporter permease subunit [Gemmatimonadota bacterium]NNK63962.1 efflux RND transporter permease subunit [Gemmatimonadota bacterium]
MANTRAQGGGTPRTGATGWSSRSPPEADDRGNVEGRDIGSYVADAQDMVESMMTVITIIAGLLPLFIGHGTGSEVMQRIAAPMVGGMVSALALTLIVIPVLYSLWHEAVLRRTAARPGA